MRVSVSLRATRTLAVLISTAVLAAACGSSSAPTESGEQATEPEPAATEITTEPVEVVVAAGTEIVYPPAPEVTDGPLDPADAETLDAVLEAIQVGSGSLLVQELETNSDARLLWLISDWLRFTQGTDLGMVMLRTAEQIAGVDFNDQAPWNDLTNTLIAWDLPAPPGYEGYKADLFNVIDERWDFVFDDPGSTIDYRVLNWGGVLIDDRELGDPDMCTRGCIPALDDPELTDAAGGDWYPDDRIVFGVQIDGEAVAFPKNIMEIHEMINMTIAGRRIGMPYCTLCGAAQVFFTDEVENVDRPPVLRTSGLLSRSNKVMYDLDSQTVFNTFTGVAVAGPLREAGVVLAQASVVTTTWADWKQAHPDTSIIAEDGGIGRTYRLDPLGGRDDDGPIFPVGDVDPRLEIQAQVLGILLPDDTQVAFPVDAARLTLQNGDPVEMAGVAVELDGEGLRATLDGEDIASNQAFWFAWSQFHPDTALWLPQS